MIKLEDNNINNKCFLQLKKIDIFTIFIMIMDFTVFYLCLSEYNDS